MTHRLWLGVAILGGASAAWGDECVKWDFPRPRELPALLSLELQLFGGGTEQECSRLRHKVASHLSAVAAESAAAAKVAAGREAAARRANMGASAPAAERQKAAAQLTQLAAESAKAFSKWSHDANNNLSFVGKNCACVERAESAQEKQRRLESERRRAIEKERAAARLSEMRARRIERERAEVARRQEDVRRLEAARRARLEGENREREIRAIEAEAAKREEAERQLRQREAAEEAALLAAIRASQVQAQAPVAPRPESTPPPPAVSKAAELGLADPFGKANGAPVASAETLRNPFAAKPSAAACESRAHIQDRLARTRQALADVRRAEADVNKEMGAGDQLANAALTETTLRVVRDSADAFNKLADAFQPVGANARLQLARRAQAAVDGYAAGASGDMGGALTSAAVASGARPETIERLGKTVEFGKAASAGEGAAGVNAAADLAAIAIGKNDPFAKAVSGAGKIVGAAGQAEKSSPIQATATVVQGVIEASQFVNGSPIAPESRLQRAANAYSAAGAYDAALRRSADRLVAAREEGGQLNANIKSAAAGIARRREALENTIIDLEVELNSLPPCPAITRP